MSLLMVDILPNDRQSRFGDRAGKIVGLPLKVVICEPVLVYPSGGFSLQVVDHKREGLRGPEVDQYMDMVPMSIDAIYYNPFGPGVLSHVTEYLLTNVVVEKWKSPLGGPYGMNPNLYGWHWDACLPERRLTAAGGVTE
jgi:hypothetical protein